MARKLQVSNLHTRPLSIWLCLIVNEGIEENSETNTKRPKLESAPGTSSSQGGTSDVGTAVGSPVSMSSFNQPSSAMVKCGGVMSSATPIAYSPSSVSPPKKPTSPKQPRNYSSMTTASTPPSPTTKSTDFAGYRESLARTTQHQQQEALTASTADTDSHFFPRIHPAVQSPHIQQQSSYLRHQPTSAPTPPPRNGVVLPSPGMRRREDTFSPMSGSISSSGSSTAPSITPITPLTAALDENTRSKRALPFPSPTPSGYFDQRAHHQRKPSQPQSPRYGQMPLPLPTIEHHSHSRSYSSSSSSSLPAPTNPTTTTQMHPLQLAACPGPGHLSEQQQYSEYRRPE